MASSKRPRPLALGASEFAAVLNGDDPTAILHTLGTFVKVVRRERRVALSQNDNSSEDDDDESNSGSSYVEESDTQPNKRLRKAEAWKQDTANYAVPFVGTAVSARDKAVVVSGEWPTGLLQAYLTKSPLAAELLREALLPHHRLHASLQKRQLHRTSQALTKVYLQALAELVTAAVPPQQLRMMASPPPPTTTTTTTTAAAAPLIRDDKPPPRFVSHLVQHQLPNLLQLLQDETVKQKRPSGCAVYLLRLLTRLAAVTPRAVARGLESLTAPGVVRFCLRKSQHTTSHIRAAAIDLAAALAHARHDAVVVSCIRSPGARDRKIPPGIWYLALHEGLATDDKHNSPQHYDRAVQEFLQTVREVLLSESSSSLIQADTLSRDALQNLTHWTLLAPKLSSHDSSWEPVVAATDAYPATTPLSQQQQAAIEARRVLWVLLTVRSSLLRTASHKVAVVRCLRQLLDHDTSVHMQDFVLRVVTVTPQLLPLIFRDFDFSNRARTFELLARLRLVSMLIRKGPTVRQCLESSRNDNLTILPAALKKQALHKLLQNKNPLVVTEVLKLVAFALERCRVYLDETPTNGEEINRQLYSYFPDPVAIFSLMLRASNPFLLWHACHVIQMLHTTLPQQEFKLDWTKLLSEDFPKASLFVQTKVLRMLLTIHGSQKVSVRL